jgi:thioester reductase-like protein
MPETRRGSGGDGLLLTGATGFVGMEVLARYLERTDRQIFTLVRAADEQEAAARLRSTVGSLLGTDEACERVVAVPADIEREGLGLDHAATPALRGYKSSARSECGSRSTTSAPGTPR